MNGMMFSDAPSTGMTGAAIVLSWRMKVLLPRAGGAGSDDSSLNSIRLDSPGFTSPITNSSSRVSASQLYDVPSSWSSAHAPRTRMTPEIRNRRIRLLRDEVETGYSSTRAGRASDRGSRLTRRERTRSGSGRVEPGREQHHGVLRQAGPARDAGVADPGERVAVAERPHLGELGLRAEERRHRGLAARAVVVHRLDEQLQREL